MCIYLPENLDAYSSRTMDLDVLKLRHHYYNMHLNSLTDIIYANRLREPHVYGQPNPAL